MAATDTGYRRIPPGACTWCGHPPHAGTCSNSIRTADPMPHGDAVTRPCPCAKRVDDDQRTREQRVEDAEDRADQAAFDAMREPQP